LHRALDILLLVLVCYLVLFANLDRHEYIKTEGLRAIVATEMLERDGWSMPTVHHQPYLNKPPLYAWTTVWLSRQADGLTEQIARIPSALAGTALVLLMFVLAERWIGRGTGLVAATFTLLCPTIADYAVRAELDLPFSFFCTANLVLTLAALRGRGLAREPVWLAAYAFALIAAMWKGPHSLIFMWLTLFGWSLVQRDWRWLRSPAQWVGLLATLAVLIWWTRALSAFAGASEVGSIAATELITRLVPYRLSSVLEIFTFIPMVLLIAIPGSIFAAMSFSRRVRHGATGTAIVEPPSQALMTRIKCLVSGWWGWMRADPVRTRLAVWIVPMLLFMLWAPAKAPRYTIPLLPPLLLLATLVAARLETGPQTTERGPQLAGRVWRGVFAVLGIVALAATVRLVAGLAGFDGGIGRANAWRPWAFLAVGAAIPLIVEVTHAGGRTLRTRAMLLLAVLLAGQPVLHDVVWPRRVANDSQRATAKRIDELVPAGERLYVLGNHEYHDVAIYADTPFEFAKSADDALAPRHRIGSHRRMGDLSRGGSRRVGRGHPGGTSSLLHVCPHRQGKRVCPNCALAPRAA
jgi:4-amino-4-deoxy-L-arabinose transferase-like glycosyltransferase